MWIYAGILLAALCLVLIGIIIYDSSRFVTVSYQIEEAKLPKSLRLVLLADLHNKQYGKNNEKLLAAIDRAKPDAILSAGDILTSVPGKSMEPAMDLVRTLAKKYPVYYGNGNHEHRIYHDSEKKYGTMGQKYRAFLKGQGVCLLENAKIDLPEFQVRIYGLDLPESYYKKFKEIPLPVKNLEKLLGKPQKDKINLLIAHNPDFFESYAEWGADLVLSGHVHGGVVRIPGGKGVISTSLKLFPKYDGGLFEKGKSKMILSRGLGSHTIPLRLFNPAELVVIDLVPAKQMEQS